MLSRHWLTRAAAIGAATLATITTAASAGGSALYVDDSAPPGGDGLSWLTAYVSLQSALADAGAAPDVVSEIRIAQGTYKPSTVVDRFATFLLVDGVALRGGFAGIGAADPDAQDSEEFRTVLSGDLLGDDGPGGSNIDDNSYHILTAEGVDAGLEGLIVAAGNVEDFPSDGRGGGLLQEGGSLSLSHCLFLGNSAIVGGAIYSFGFCELEIDSCTFIGNFGEVGGAINFREGTLTITRSMFADNGNIGFAGGGAIAAFTIYDVFIDETTFSGNSSGAGAAMVAVAETLAIANCIFAGNSGGFIGGAIEEASASTSIVNCLFAANEASLGGGLYTGTPGAQVVNCTFVNNGNIALMSSSFGTPEVANCIFHGNDGEPIAEDPPVPGQPTAVTFSNVQGGWPGAGNIDADPIFALGPTGSWTDQAQFDGQLWRTTYSDDAAAYEPGALAGKLLAPAPDFVGLELAIESNTATTITVLGDFALLGFPGFAYAINDYRLLSGSPSVDAGDNSAVSMGSSDLDGNPRVVDDPDSPDCPQNPGECGTPPIVDMGPYELQPEPPGPPCFEVVSEEVACNPGASGFTYTAQGTDSCTGALMTVSFTGSGGAVGEMLCATIIIQGGDGGFCCTTQLCAMVPDCAPGAAPRDIDGDGAVGMTDLLALLARWGTDPQGPPDFDGDGIVGITDLLELLEGWGGP